MTLQEKQKLADKLVSNFINRFKESIGVKPLVHYSIESDFPTINEVFNLVNAHFKIRMGDNEASICEDNREVEYIKYRNVYFSICRDYGYTLMEIGKPVGRNYATVIHGSRKANEKLKIEIKEKLL